MSMEKIFRNKSYFFSAADRLPAIAVVIAALCWLPTALLLLMGYSGVYQPFLRLSIASTLTVIFFSLLAAIILNDLCNTFYIITDSSITIKRPYRTAVMHFDNIINFRYAEIPVIKGFGVITVKGVSVRLPFFINDLPEFIETLRLRLDAYGNGKYDEKNISHFLSVAVSAERNRSRISMMCGPFYRIVMYEVFAGIIVSRVFWDMYIIPALIWTGMSLVFPVAGFAVSEIVIRAVSVRTTASVDTEQIYRITIVFAVAGYFIAGILFKCFILMH
jgi:hypothetical protein